MHEMIYSLGSSQCLAPRDELIIYIREAPSFFYNVNYAYSVNFSAFGESNRTGAGYFNDADAL